MIHTKQIYFIYFLFLGFTVIAQTKEELVLVNLIVELEVKFDVKFSYNLDEVNSVLVVRPNEDASLESIISDLNETTLLNFKFLTARYITISTIEKTISICGVLKTEASESLYGASVYVSGASKGVVTDENGNFILHNIDISHNITMSFLGFETKIIQALKLRGNEDCATVILKSKSEALNEIVISKFLTTGLQQRRDGSTQLNTDKFGILPGLTEPDVLQSIQALPGVESINESIANINVRGGTNDQNLMLWDGIKMYHSGHFFGLISAYNPYLTSKVIVTKNGTSSAYSDGVSSTINMFTKDKVNQEFSGGFGANLLHTDAFLEVPIRKKKMALHVSGRRSFTDVFNSPTYANYFERSFQDTELTTTSADISEVATDSEFYFYDYSAKLLFDLNEKHKFRAHVIGISNNLDYEEEFTNTANQSESKTSNLKQENLGFGGYWEAKWNSRFETHLSSYYSKYNVDAVDYRVETNQQLTQANEVLETGLKLNTNYKIHNNLNFLNGYQFTEVGILNGTTVNNPDYSKTKKEVLLNHAFYSEIELKTKSLFLRGGVRLNYFQKFNKLIIEPRLNFRYQLVRDLAVKLQGEFKNQSATQIIDFQDDFLGVENRRWILANEQTIPISESKQGSFGFQYQKNNFVVDIEAFYKTVEGITAFNQGFYNNFQFINAIGNYTVKGLEFLINKTADSYSTWASYTYSTNDYEFESLTPSVFPNNADLRHSVSLAFNYDVLQNLKASIGGVWRSGQPFTKPLAGNETVQNGNSTFVNYDTPNNENLEDFRRLDASLNYTFKLNGNMKSSIKVGVINLLDRKNIISSYYKVDPNDANNSIQVKNKSLGLTPNISFRCNF
ncbi:TonB-dependent receptor [Winogradskyella psychrotolerans]|uniref:TonB-dependent receptor n=1 Tax=Winogradskyella psychrotolerans TaxID=1344585 RepID=UPI001C06610B|nr:carboxypeptidase-like regulatory domain-containing protein [Winogradskyella psychrotolerans]MBU2930219.1 TonB-dependent receptor [Winogradskyella psychrotolerans]